MASATESQPVADGSGDAALRALVASPGAACPHCTYSLEGLARSGVTPTRCPECGGGLEAGLVRGVGPGRMRRVMVLMFAWLAFAGCMNATRRGIAVFDWLDMQRFVPARTATRSLQGGVLNPSTVTITSGPRMTTPMPTTWWLELGGWSVLGLLGLWGIIATLALATTVQREKRLVVLLVLGFIAYSGYHGFQFAIELAARL